MLEINNIINYCKNKKFKNNIIQSLSNKYNFKETEKLPLMKGIYFIYKNDDKNPIYIGCAYEVNRTIKIRCKQYIQQGSGGRSLRKKINEHITNSISLNGDECYNREIPWLKENCYIKYLTLNKNNSSEILLLERICILNFTPKLND